MKRGKKQIYYITLFALLGLGVPSTAQPFFDMETFPVCYDSVGVKQNLVSVNVYSLGTSKVLFQSYVNQTGQKVVPGAGTTIYDAPCYEAITEDTLNIVTYESSIPFETTIAEGLYERVMIQNIGLENQNINVDGLPIRMRPGEYYSFTSTVNPVTNVITRNPAIVLSVGTLGENNLRVTLETAD
ncbi:MAG: hypothetical protein AAFU60_17600 [Bacteroidota bacterium]